MPLLRPAWDLLCTAMIKCQPRQRNAAYWLPTGLHCSTLCLRSKRAPSRSLPTPPCARSTPCQRLKSQVASRQLAVHTTCVPSLDPVSRGRALTLGPACSARNTAQASRHPELSRSPCCLVVFVVETSGRWGLSPQPSSGFAHVAVCPALRAAYASRWSGIIAMATQRALASSLLEFLLDAVASAAGESAVHEVLQDERWLHAPAPGRLPART